MRTRKKLPPAPHHQFSPFFLRCLHSLSLFSLYSFHLVERGESGSRHRLENSQAGLKADVALVNPLYSQNLIHLLFSLALLLFLSSSPLKKGCVYYVCGI